MVVENELKKLKKFDVACFRGKNYFDGSYGMKYYVVFQPMYNYFKTSVQGSTTYVSPWESKGLSNEKISSITNLIIIKLQAWHMIMLK